VAQTVKITPASGLLEFIGNTTSNKPYLQHDDNGNLTLTLQATKKFTVAGNLKVNGKVTMAQQTLTDGAAITWDFNSGANAKVTIAGARTLVLSNMETGDTGLILVKQDAAGSRTLTLPGSSSIVGGGTYTASPAANATDVLGVYYDGTTYWWTIGYNTVTPPLTSVGITGADFTIANSPLTANGNIGLALATVNSNVGQFGSATAVPVITVNAKGLVTAVSATNISIPTNLDSLTDVTITSAATGQLLQFNGSQWVNWTPNYITSYTETDTLATVTGRGAATNTAVTFNGNVTLGNAADLRFVDLAGTFPTSGKGFDWTLNNDGARIYAIQPSSDSIDLVFQLRDNATTNDRFVFWVDDYQGAAFDKYPLIIRGGTEVDLVDAGLFIRGNQVLTNARVLQNISGNISMFTNDSAYITGYTETDTLATVTGRGSTTSSSITAERYRGNNSLILNSFTTVNPSSNVFLYSQPNDRDSWIYLDSADTGSNWGIYHRQIDSAVGGMEGNSIGFIGGGANALRAYIGLSTGNGYFAGTLSASQFNGSGAGLTGTASSLSVSYATTAGALTSMNISQFTNNSGYLTSVSDIWVDLAGDTMTGILRSSYNTATGIANNGFNVAKTILGNLHISNGGGASGNNYQAALTFQGDTASEAQAGIYVSNNGSTGTAMGFATTNSYATGPQLFMTATNGGVVNFPRATPTVQGNTVWHTGNDGAGSGLDADLLDGYHVSGTVGANTVVIRDANGYIYANYINTNVSETENPSISSFFTSNGDGWLRKSTIAHVRSSLGNYGGWLTQAAANPLYVNVTGDSMTGPLVISGVTSGQELFAVNGVNGRLFTVTDDLSNSLFSVNTEAFANNTVNLGPFSAPIVINASGISTPSHGTSANWNSAYNDTITSAAVSGTTSKTLTLTQRDGGTVTATWTDIDTDTNTDAQTLSVSGSTLTISGGNSITLPTSGISQGTADSLYVNVSGDVMTGSLYIFPISDNPAQFQLSGSNPELYVSAKTGTARVFINRQASGHQATLMFTTAMTHNQGSAWDYTGAPMWSMGMTNNNNTNSFKLGYGDIYDPTVVALEITTANTAYFKYVPYAAGNLLATQSWVTSQGYITGYTETDTLNSVTSRGNTTGNNIITSANVYASIFYDYDDNNYYVNPTGLSRLSHISLNTNWANTPPNHGAINIRGNYPSMTFRNTASNSMWLRHMDGSGDIQHYYAGDGVDSVNWSIKHSMFANGNFYSAGTHTASQFNGSGAGLTGTASSLSVNYANTAGYSDEAKWISFPDGPRDLSDRLPNWNNRSVAWDFVGAGTANGSGNYGGVMTFSPWDGTSGSTGDSSYQLAFANNTGVNASGQPKLSIRNGINSTWNAWYTLWHAGNDGAGSGLDADLLDGYTSDTAANVNTIVRRDSSGNIYSNYVLGSYFNASAGNSENPTIGQIWTQNTSDNYLRKSTPAHFRSQVIDGYYLPLSGGTVTGTLDLSNNTLQGVGHIIMSDSGFGEGIQWENWFICDSPNDDSNQAGNLQFVYVPDNGVRMTFDTTGTLTISDKLIELSSIRYKTQVESLTPALDKVLQLRPVHYVKIGGTGETEIGLIAEEVAEIYPELVKYDSEGQVDGINYTRIAPILIKTIQEQHEIIKKLTERIENLENR